MPISPMRPSPWGPRGASAIWLFEGGGGSFRCGGVLIYGIGYAENSPRSGEWGKIGY